MSNNNEIDTSNNNNKEDELENANENIMIE